MSLGQAPHLARNTRIKVLAINHFQRWLWEIRARNTTSIAVMEVNSKLSEFLNDKGSYQINNRSHKPV